MFVINEYHKFRHAAELTKETHGGYLEGSLKIPEELTYADFSLELYPVSLSNSSQYEHPNLLHLTELHCGKKNKKEWVYKTKLNSSCWKMKFSLSGFPITSTMTHYAQNKSGIEEITISNARKDNSIYFGRDFGIKLTIITPLQKNGKGVSIPQVLHSRGDNGERWFQKTDTHDPKIELHRCRLLAVFKDALTGREYKTISNNIFDVTDKYVGQLSILSIHNCHEYVDASQGHKEVCLISKFKIDPKIVHPLIMVRSESEDLVNPCKYLQDFSQICRDEIKSYHNTVLVFNLPNQSACTMERLKDVPLYICLFRDLDGRISKPLRSFFYHQDIELMDVVETIFNNRELDVLNDHSLLSSISSSNASQPSPTSFSDKELNFGEEFSQFITHMDSNEEYMPNFDLISNIMQDSAGKKTSSVEVKGFPSLRMRTPLSPKENSYKISENPREGRDSLTYINNLFSLTEKSNVLSFKIAIAVLFLLSCYASFIHVEQI